MIHKNAKVGNVENVTVLEFGTGDIEFTPSYKHNGKVALSFKTTPEQHEIGVKRNNTHYKDTDSLVPEVVFFFSKVESIDAVISSLQDCREIFVNNETKNE